MRVWNLVIFFGFITDFSARSLAEDSESVKSMFMKDEIRRTLTTDEILKLQNVFTKLEKDGRELARQLSNSSEKRS